MTAGESEEQPRALQQTVGGTYTISLPKRWIRKMNLKSGSLLNTVPQDGSLLVIPSTARARPQIKATIQVTSKDRCELIQRMIDSAYAVGYDEISVETKETEIEKDMRDHLKDHVTTKLTGITIVIDSSKKLELKATIGFEQLSMKYVLEKMRDNIISIHEDAVRLLEEVGRLDNEAVLDKAGAIRLRDNLVDSLHLLGIRLLKAAADNLIIRAKIGLTTGRECLGYRLIIKSMERIGDHAAKICRNISSLQRRISKEILNNIQDMSKHSLKTFSDAMDSFFEYMDKCPNTFLRANSIMDDAANVSSFEEKIDKLLFGEGKRMETGKEERIPPKELSAIKIIVESIRRTAEYSSDIAEIVLNLTVIDAIEGRKQS
ncbi:DUF47 family protein [Candidatus Bathyarchaeota archaeon]|nr:DUF47 family protein [Candidatus Bathyarchaeota archaeon]